MKRIYLKINCYHLIVNNKYVFNVVGIVSDNTKSLKNFSNLT